jgi:hypothetical protein
LRTGLPSSSTTRPVTTIFSPSGSLCAVGGQVGVVRQQDARAATMLRLTGTGASMRSMPAAAGRA